MKNAFFKFLALLNERRFLFRFSHYLTLKIVSGSLFISDIIKHEKHVLVSIFISLIK